MQNKASKKCGFDISYLDFEKIPDSSELKKQVSECGWMGSLGVQYIIQNSSKRLPCMGIFGRTL